MTGNDYSDTEKIDHMFIMHNGKWFEFGPIVHAHWIKKEDSTYTFCSHCGFGFYNLISEPKYCEGCGAKMDEKSGDKQ